MEQRTPADVLRMLSRTRSRRVVDFRFCDLPGLMQHFSVPAHQLSEDAFEEGYGFDGSSIRGFQEIQESDMILIPDPNTAVIDPFRQHKTLNINCFVRDPVTGEPYSRDPRYVAKKAEDYLKSTGIADTAYFGPEAEFYIFDDVRFDQDQHSAYYSVDSVEGIWNSARDEGPNLGYKPRYKEGYFPVPPMDHYQDLRSEMVLIMEQVGIEIEVQHHEVGTAGQAEIDMRFDTLLAMADKLMLYKYVVKNVARRGGKSVDVHAQADLPGQRLGHARAPVAVEGRRAAVLRRDRATPGCPTWPAGTSAACSSTPRRSWRSPRRRPTPTSGWCRATRRRSTSCTRSATARRRCRIPLYSKSPKAKRVEFRCPDPSCNPYLAFSAMLMAGLDGVQNRIEPPDPVDKDLYDLPARGAGEGPAGARLARRGARRPRGRPRVPARRRRLHARPHRHLDRLQARARDRPRPAPPPPVGVPPLLRHLGPGRRAGGPTPGLVSLGPRHEPGQPAPQGRFGGWDRGREAR